MMLLSWLGLPLVFAAPAPPAEIPVQIEADPARLARLGRVWGWVKHHHPRFASGELDADAWLRELLPAVVDAADLDAADAVMVAAIEALGPVEPSEVAIPPDRTALADLSWPSTLPPALGLALEGVRAGRPTTRRKRVGRTVGLGLPDWSFESSDADGPLDDVDRLIALYRFWNVIEWSSPYRHLLEDDWTSTLEAHIPDFLEASNPRDYHRALARFAVHVHDSHTIPSGVWDLPPEGRCAPPVQLGFVEGAPTVVASTSPALAPGDVILAVQGRPVDDLIDEMWPYYPGSHDAGRRRNIAKWMLTGPCGPFGVTTDRGDAELERTYWDLPRKDGRFRRLTPDIGYVGLGDLGRRVGPALRPSRGLIIDARPYPNRFWVFSLGRRLVEQEEVFARFTVADPVHPGHQMPSRHTPLVPRGKPYPGQVVVLIDEHSQSSAEYHAMAFAAGPRTTLVGAPTVGADGNVVNLPLPGGARVAYTALGVYHPDGGQTQRLGIQPDIWVEPTREGVRAGRDEVLEAGLRLLAPELSEAEVQALARPRWRP